MDKTVYFSIPKEVTHGRGYIYSLQYHIIWVTKYRKPIFLGGIESDVKDYLLETLKSLDMIPIAMEIMPDHIHLLVDCKPQLKLSDAMKILKGNTARWSFLKHLEMKKQLLGGHLWNPSYLEDKQTQKSASSSMRINQQVAPISISWGSSQIGIWNYIKID